MDIYCLIVMCKMRMKMFYPGVCLFAVIQSTATKCLSVISISQVYAVVPKCQSWTLLPFRPLWTCSHQLLLVFSKYFPNQIKFYSGVKNAL